MTRITLVSCLLISLIASSSACGDEVARASDETVAAVRQHLQRQDLAFNSDNLDGFLKLIASDAVIMPPGERELVGLAEIRAWYDQLFDKYEIEMLHLPGPVELVGSLIVHRGMAQGRLTPRDGGASITFDNKYITLMRMRADGSLEHWRLKFNANPIGDE